MYFANPFLLWGLIGAGLPVLIHLLGRRRTKTVDFPTLRWLRVSSRKAMRRVQFRQWILLLIRVLAIIAAIGALAGPWVRDRRTPLGQSPVDVMIVLDDSASMAARPGLESFMERARARALEIINFFSGEKDRIFFHKTSAGALKQFEPATREQIESLVKSSEPSFIPQAARGKILSIVDGFFSGTANKQADSDSSRKRIIFYITDMQAADAPADWKTVSPLKIIDAGENFRNDWLDCEPLPERPLRIGESIKWKFEFHSSDPEPQTKNVDFYVDDVKRSSRDVKVSSANPGSGSVNVTADKPGAHFIRLETPDDPRADDNVCFGIIRVRAPISTLLADTAPDPETPVGILLKAALSPPETQGPFKITTGKISGLAQAKSGGFSLLILPAMDALNSGEAGAVLKFVNAGGGLIGFMGNNFSPGVFNSIWSQALKVKASTPVAPRGRENFLTPDQVNLEHPALSAFGSQRDLEELRLQWLVPLDVGNSGASVLMRADNGHALEIEIPYGNGRILVFATSLSWSMSQWLASPQFVVLIQGAGGYASGGTGSIKSFLNPGMETKWRLRPGENFTSASWSGPLGVGGTVFPRSDSGGAYFLFTETSAPGACKITFKQDEREKGSDGYVVNAPRSESDPKRIDLDEIRRKSSGLDVWNGASAITQRLEALRGGFSIRLHFALAAIALLMLDLALSNFAAFKGQTDESASVEEQ